jgi:hypothetical protein
MPPPGRYFPIVFLASTLIFFLSIQGFAQQTDVKRFDVYTGFTGFETPELNLAERGFHLQTGVNLRTWLSAGFDYSVVTGHNSLTANLLKTSLQQELGLQIEQLIEEGVIPAGYQLIVPTDAFSQTFALGPELTYRRLTPITLFVRPSLGAIRQKVTPHPTDPVATAIVAELVPAGSKVDWTGFYGFGRRRRLECDRPHRPSHADRSGVLEALQRPSGQRHVDRPLLRGANLSLRQEYRLGALRKSGLIATARLMMLERNCHG